MSTPNVHSHLGVYALIQNTAAEVLLIRKARGPYTGLLDLPGGSPEIDELLEETLVREIQEETGCTTTAHRQLGAVSLRYPYTDPTTGVARTLRHFGVLFQASISGTPNQGADGHDSLGCVWRAPTPATLAACTPMVALALNLAAH